MATRIKSVKDDKATIARVTAKLEDLTIGEKIDKLWALREKKRLIQKEIDAIENEVGALKELVIADLGVLKLDGSRGKKASANINEKISATVADWDKAHAFIQKNGYTHLYKKEILATGFRELLERMGEKKLQQQASMSPFRRYDITLTSV